MVNGFANSWLDLVCALVAHQTRLFAIEKIVILQVLASRECVETVESRVVLPLDGMDSCRQESWKAYIQGPGVCSEMFWKTDRIFAGRLLVFPHDGANASVHAYEALIRLRDLPVSGFFAVHLCETPRFSWQLKLKHVLHSSAGAADSDAYQ